MASINCIPQETAPTKAAVADSLHLNTTGALPLYRIGARVLCSPVTRVASPIKTAIAAVLLTYVPMFLACLISGGDVTARMSRFLHDWNTAFTFLVSFPFLLITVLRDESLLVDSVRRVRADGVLIVTDDEMGNLCLKWERKFRNFNLAAQVLAVFAGGVVAWLLCSIYLKNGSWMTANKHLLFPIGPVFLWSIFLFYGLIPIFAARCIAISLFFRDLAAFSEFSVLPFHPDRSGGFRPVGEVGLRNQYALSIIGLNLLSWMASHIHDANAMLHNLIVVVSGVYLLLGPVVFLGPLLPFREGMLRNKAALMSEVAQRLRSELHRMHLQLKEGEITEQDEGLIDRLRKMGAVIDELPVWPYDITTARRFLSAYLTPAVGVLIALAKKKYLNG